jgi:hypothetical protein
MVVILMYSTEYVVDHPSGRRIPKKTSTESELLKGEWAPTLISTSKKLLGSAW